MNLLLLVRAYQVSGHLKAKLNPLGLEKRPVPDVLDLALYGFFEVDLDRKFFHGVRTAGFLSEKRPVQTLRSVIEQLEQAYCSTIGYEYMHIPNREKCNWLRDRIETVNPRNYTSDRCQRMLHSLMWSTQFENFLVTKCSTASWFGVAGSETVIAGMKGMFDRAANLGVESIVVGVPHRGALSVLGNFIKKTSPQIFRIFTGGTESVKEDGLYTGTDDISCLLGTSYDWCTWGGKDVHLSLVANTSHLEAVDPVVAGRVRAKQYYCNDRDRTKNLGVLLHCDGSFSGQGVVYETLLLSAHENYATGGTIHIVVSDQVVFNTDQSSGRSSQYCTDLAKALEAPIFHVNSEDLEAVVHALELAAEWQHTFHSDAVVDIICCQRSGHNEMNTPSFIQPKMYKVNRNHQSALEIYQRNLLESGKISKKKIDKANKKFSTQLDNAFQRSKDYVPNKREPGFKSQEEISLIQKTGVKSEILKHVGEAMTSLPENFKAHSTVENIFGQWRQMIETGEGVDWAVGEALAFGTLIVEGYHVRRSGQNVERGTFSQCHSVIYDQETGEQYCPLDHLVKDQGLELFTVTNSPMSGFAVLGFELGYSMENPKSLVIWEAQFGDFANEVQVIFDLFLRSLESKWLCRTGLVVCLPHGYDGQRPEHSSARLERFLEMSDDNPYVIPEDPTLWKQTQQCNWQVVNVTTPANYFHVLRRQIHRDFRKPLIVMSSKNLLHHKDCKSNLSEFDDLEGHPGFKRLIKDQNDHKDLEEGTNRLVLCSGKVYYELDEERRKTKRTDVAICRVEQLCPFPYDLIQREMKRYPNAEIVWCQEEPMNMGAYPYINPRLLTVMKALGRGGMEIKYVGRAPSHATATGNYSMQVHVQELAGLVHKALQRDTIK